MSPENELIDKLTTLNHIAETLNRAVDTTNVLDGALADLVRLMGLETGWIFTTRPAIRQPPEGGGYVLAAHHNLPPALDPENAEAWAPVCSCQMHWAAANGGEAYNAIECSRLGMAQGDRRGLAVHASAPLRSGERTLGILNVAGPDWASFSPEALALLTNVGSQMGIALERARLFDLLQERRVHEQAALLEFSTQLLQRSRLDELTAYLVDQVCQMLHADACALVLPGEQPGLLDFQAASGWQVDPARERRQVPLSEATGLAHVMRSQVPLLVQDIEDSALKPRMPDWLRAEGLRGHAVVPLIADGRSIGALVIGTRQPRLLDEGDLRFLHLMANQAALAIEKARLHQEEVKGQALEKELEVGQQIQLSLLPESTPVVPGWEFAVHYQAARLMGGDFYDFFNLPGQPDRLGVVIADVVGKGVPAALFMALSRTVIRATALGSQGPAAALIQANPLIWKDNRSESFLTALYATLDTASGRMAYANAGHPRPLWLRADAGTVEELSARGTVLGAFGDIELEEREVSLAPGDLLILYTDGVTEAVGADYHPFGLERLRSAVAGAAGASAPQVLASIVQAVRAFVGDAPPSDDVAILVIRYCPEGLL